MTINQTQLIYTRQYRDINIIILDPTDISLPSLVRGLDTDKMDPEGVCCAILSFDLRPNSKHRPMA